MAIQLGSAYGKISLDVKGLRDGVKNGVSDLQRLQKAGMIVGHTLSNVGNALTIGLTLPILAMGAASISAASDFEETRNKAVVVFGEMANSVVSNSNKAATALGLSKTQYLDYASSLGAAFTAGGLGIKESTELAEGAVKHFADLASFHNARVEDVATAWQSAIRGQYEPIQRYFPFITNEYLKTYGTANGLLDANTQNLTANQRAILLNAIALDEKLNPAIDDFAETSGGLANQTRIMKAQWQDALILLGQNLLPVALKVVSALNKMLESFNNLSPAQQKVMLGFLGFLAALGPLLSGLGTLITAVSTLGGLFKVGGTLASASSVFASLGSTVSTVAVPAVAALGAALLPILAVIASLILAAGIFAVVWKTDFLFVRSAAETTAKIIQSLWSALTAFLRGDTEEALEFLLEAFDTFGEHINKVFEKIFNIKDAWGKFLNFMRDMLGRLVTYIRDTFSRIDWSLVGKYILQGIANGMLLGLPSLIAMAAKVAQDLLDTIRKNLGITSPSKEAMKLGMYTAQGFQLGLNRISPEDMARSLTRPITNMNSSQQQTIIQNFASGLTVSQARQMIEQNNEQLVNTMINALSGA
jgi:hypothetical protein